MLSIGLSQLDHTATLLRERLRHPSCRGARIYRRRVNTPRQRVTDR